MSQITLLQGSVNNTAALGHSRMLASDAFRKENRAFIELAYLTLKHIICGGGVAGGKGQAL